MTKAEKKTKPYQRPVRWFTPKEYKLANHVKVFSITTSNGFSTSFVCPKPYDHLQFAAKIKTQVGPFLKRCFPDKRSIRLILDSEFIQHAPPCKREWKKFKVSCLPNWPTRSPALNPQENVWAWAEDHLRTLERDGDSLEKFTENCLKAVAAYPSKAKLVGNMAKRIEECLAGKGHMTRR